MGHQRFLTGLAVAILALGLSGTGCGKLKEEAKARGAKTQAAVQAEYARLAFMIPLLDAGGRQTISCNDKELPSRLRKSSRMCERLQLTDEAHVRRLFGKGPAPAPVPGEPSWAWMRTLEFQRLGPLEQIPAEGLPLQTHDSGLRRLADTNVGVFTRNESPPAEVTTRYRGWLVIIDTVEEKVRCQVAIDADVSKIFTPPTIRRGETTLKPDPRPHIQAFWRDVDKQLKPITKNFCAD